MPEGKWLHRGSRWNPPSHSSLSVGTPELGWQFVNVGNLDSFQTVYLLTLSCCPCQHSPNWFDDTSRLQPAGKGKEKQWRTKPLPLGTWPGHFTRHSCWYSISQDLVSLSPRPARGAGHEPSLNFYYYRKGENGYWEGQLALSLASQPNVLSLTNAQSHSKWQVHVPPLRLMHTRP